jgi:hypothetical protein
MSRYYHILLAIVLSANLPMILCVKERTLISKSHKQISLLDPMVDIMSDINKTDCGPDIAPVANESCIDPIHRESYGVWTSGVKERAYCCFSYDMIECLQELVAEECHSNGTNSLREMLSGRAVGLHNGRCFSYGYEWYDWRSWKCHIPWIMIGVFAVVVIVVAVIIGYLCSR